MTKIARSLYLSIFLIAFTINLALAGGLYLYEIGTPDVGLAAAGYAARAQALPPSSPTRRV